MNTLRAIERLRRHLLVNLDSELDLSNDALAMEALMEGLRWGSREALTIWAQRAALSLAGMDGERELDLLSADVCAMPVFDPFAVRVNGRDLWQIELVDLPVLVPNWHSASPSATPSYWMLLPDGKIQFDVPLTGAALTSPDSFVSGFAEHPEYTLPEHAQVELYGPKAAHMMYVDRAAIEAAIGLASDPDAQAHLKQLRESYETRRSYFSHRNAARARAFRRRDTAGRQRRPFDFASNW